MDESVSQLISEITGVCEFLGYAEIESDDGGDRWLSFTRDELSAEVRARYIGDKPVWEITVRRGYKTMAIECVEREDG